MTTTKLKKYILGRGLTITAVAKEIKLSRVHLTEICNGYPAGRRAAKKIADWSGGIISEADVMLPDIHPES